VGKHRDRFSRKASRYTRAPARENQNGNPGWEGDEAAEFAEAWLDHVR